MFPWGGAEFLQLRKKSDLKGHMRNNTLRIYREKNVLFSMTFIYPEDLIHFNFLCQSNITILYSDFNISKA